MDFTKDKGKKFKVVYYKKGDINDWVYENPTPASGNKGNNTALLSVQEIKLYDKTHKKSIGNVLQHTTSYDTKLKEIITYEATYFFPDGSISFDLDFNGQTTDRKVNVGKYVFKIQGGTGKYLNIEGYVLFEVLPDKNSTRKVKFFTK